MGMFDSVFFKCSKCACDIEIQSKAGECGLYMYEPNEVPMAVATDIIGEFVDCDDCGKRYRVTCELSSFVRLTLVDQ